MNNRSLGLQRRCEIKVNLMFQAGKYENPRWPPWNLLILIYQLVIVRFASFLLKCTCENLYKIMNMVSFDKSKEPKIKNKDGSHECNSFYLGFSIFDQEPLERRFGSWHIWNQHIPKPLHANFHAFLDLPHEMWKCLPLSHTTQ